ncbi:hypothetical protein GYMLUDRAFT_252009 [Collybiopsis luxurians FD-317 M1]|uniref:Uncharacterized protein n=1 Tax=Collybiopsis luxurians FD-317 M1 TaxID=944289 RepID=A0A0D0C9P6_9AGAR|nr:hypothetical protein GYMLUDRAFT_252009 [Collybiopsis luxurians FD-317 M1]
MFSHHRTSVNRGSRPRQVFVHPKGNKQVPLPPIIHITSRAVPSIGTKKINVHPYLAGYQSRVPVRRPISDSQAPVPSSSASAPALMNAMQQLQIGGSAVKEPDQKMEVEEDVPTEIECTSRESSVESMSTSSSAQDCVSVLRQHPPPEHLPKLGGNQYNISQTRFSQNTILINEFRRILASFRHMKFSDVLISGKEKHTFDDMRNFKFTVKKDSSIYDHLKEAIPQRNWQKESIFYFPGCIHTTVTGAQHLLAFGPLEQSIPNFKDEFTGEEHKIRSRFTEFYDKTRELFVKRKNGFGYAGRYKMHSLLEKAPEGLYIPDYVSLEEIVSSALPTFCPKNFPTYAQLCDLYKSGTLRVECVALELVDRDESVYKALERVQRERVPPNSRPKWVKAKGLGRETDREGKKVVKEGRIEKVSKSKPKVKGLKRQGAVIVQPSPLPLMDL